MLGELLEARLEVKSQKKLTVSDKLGCGVMHKGFGTLPKVSKTWRFCGGLRNVGMPGTLEEDLQRCISRGRRSTRDMFIRDVRRYGRWSPERGCILEHQIFRFGKMILCDKCSTSDGVEKSQNTLVRGRQLCTHLCILEGSLAELLRFWCCQLRNLRTSRRTALFLAFQNIENISQNGCVCHVVKFKNWGSFAGKLRFQPFR